MSLLSSPSSLFRAWTFLSAIFSLLLGGTVLVGWHIQVFILTQFSPTFPSVVYNAAVCFIVSGVGLLAAIYRQKFVVFLCGFLSTAIGFLVLLQYVSYIDLGIDQLFVPVNETVLYPGRMTPNTSLGFLLVGILLLMNSRPLLKSRLMWIVGLDLTLLSVAFWACVNYFIGVDTSYGLSSAISMPPQIALGLFLLGTGIFTLAWEQSMRHGVDLTLSFPFLIVIVILLATMSLWEALKLSEQNHIKVLTKMAAESAAESVRVLQEAPKQGSQRLLNMAINGEIARRYNIAIYSGKQKLFQQGESNALMEKLWAQRAYVNVAGENWQINAWPNEKLLERLRSYLEIIALVVGAILAVLCGYAVYFTQTARQMTSLTRATLESTNDGILVIDNYGNIVDYNQRLLDMWKIPVELMKANQILTVINAQLAHLLEPDKFMRKIQEFVSDAALSGLDEIQFKDNRVFEQYTQPQRIAKKIVGRVFSFRDITEHKRLEEQLLRQATHDVLTGLPNRALLTDRIHQVMRYAKRFEQLAAVLFIDLDRFKVVNNSLGHTVGDQLLQAVADRLRQAVRDSDTVARLGGDEFVIVLSNLEKASEAMSVAHKCLDVVSKTYQVSGRNFTISASLGISIYPKDGQDVIELLKNADTAMFRAKELGRNNCQFFTEEMNRISVEQLEMEADLRIALQRKELLLHYQPFFSFETGTVCGVEALVRWQHPQLGWVPPQKFLRIAEEVGLINEITDWILKSACAQNKAWQQSGLSPLRIAVNISAYNLTRSDIVVALKKILDETELEPRYLELELTETTLMENSNELLAAMAELKQFGIMLAIDDFGTGYSSLSYLRQFPIDKLKIDQSFIHDITTSNDALVIVKTIIAMGNSLKLRVLAEGVETEEQWMLLRSNRCHEMQGYFFSKPLDADAFALFLRQHKS